MGLCILAGGSVAKAYATVALFTLAWTHSVEKIEWQEDWRIAGDRLVLTEARVHGTGAGMEAPAGARLGRSGWSWQPNLAPLAVLTLRRSGATADWRLCIEGQCGDLGDIVGDADPVELAACEAQVGRAAGRTVYDRPGSAAAEEQTRAR
jgi:hypothetical protein